MFAIPHVGVVPHIISIICNVSFLPVLKEDIIIRVHNIYTWMHAIQDSRNVVGNMFKFIEQSWTLILMVSVSLNRNLYVKYFNGINKLTLYGKRSGIPSLNTHRGVQRAQLGLLLMVILSYALIGTRIFSKLHSGDFGFANLAQTLYSFLSIFHTAGITIHVLYWMLVYERIFSRLLELLRQEFEDRKRCTNLNGLIMNSFGDKLRLYQKYYASYILNYQGQMLSFTSFVFNIYTFLIIIICQIFTFLYTSFFIQHSELEVNGGTVSKLLQSIFSVSITYYTIKRSNDIYTIPDHIINYLHTYPISQLTVEEIHLVEGLIQYLTTYRPTLVPDDIFELQRKTFPSVLGQVITYSLVALQFNIFSIFY